MKRFSTLLLAVSLTVLFSMLGINTVFAAPSDDFVTTWKTDNPGASNSTSITIPTQGGGFNYDVDWDNNGTFDELGLSGDVTHDFGVAGTYTIRIQGSFPRINFNDGGDKEKIISIDQWGTGSWSSFQNAFYGCSNLVGNATDVPDLSSASRLTAMFRGATVFNQDISGWDTSTITRMNNMFRDASAFNQDISGWDTSLVENMSGMFRNSAFNQDISGWDTSAVTNMSAMFRGSPFNQDISGWDTAMVDNMSAMFRNATSFDQNLSGWDVTSLTDASNMFNSVTLSTFNYDALLNGWDAQVLLG